MKGFDWLELCTLCNTDCCHSIDKFLPKNQCSRYPQIQTEISDTAQSSSNYVGQENSKDYRPIECRLFPFDIIEIDNKMMWIKKETCHATPKLNYEKFMDFFEKGFYKDIPIAELREYISERKSIDLKDKEYVIIREINPP